MHALKSLLIHIRGRKPRINKPCHYVVETLKHAIFSGRVAIITMPKLFFNVRVSTRRNMFVK